VADDRNENGRGARIRELSAGGPADKAGLQASDLITAINGQPIHTLDDMAQALLPIVAGGKVDFQVERAGGNQTLAVVLGTRPPKAERRFPEFGRVPEDVGPASARPPAGSLAGVVAPGGPPLLGVRTVPLSLELRRRFKVAADVDGALVSAVTIGSPADVAGIMIGMLITAVNGQSINGPDGLSALIRQAGPGREVELTWWDQDGQQHRGMVTLAGGNAAGRSAPGPRPMDNDPLMADPAAPPPPRNGPTIEALQQRIRQLELRIEKLEAAQARRGN
jgi:serine protease Do